ncbi:hypothetical protein AB1K83_04980 [Sporosarcina sp. 179-K 3D1 HS]|uniref:hypothetical protein n=1 Tax=Sporosarcina sp. 179-K 3D1 HS TaxID=3232169 RepID=UPI0039A22323
MLSTKEELRNRKRQKFLKVCKTLRVCDSCIFKELVMMGDRSNDREMVESICGGCPNYKEMRIVGDDLWKTDTNIEAILQKRQDITTNEIVMLLKEGVPKKKIREALGMKSVIEFREFITLLSQIKIGECSDENIRRHN